MIGRDEAERLVENFELAVTEMVKEANFRKGGSSKKTFKEYENAKAALMKRLTGEGA